jgi:hypothetical protein
MAMRIRESPDSREVFFGSDGGGQNFKLVVLCTSGESETQVFNFVLVNSQAFWNGFIRKSMRVRPAPAFRRYEVEIEYGTSGVGGGDQPLGGVGGDGGPPTPPTAPASPTTPLTSGWSFQINAPRIHYPRSRNTVSATKRGGGTPVNYFRRIGVDPQTGSAAGVDWPPDPSFTLTRTWGRGNVTPGYLETLALLAGRTNIVEFYGYDAGDVIFLSASGNYTSGEGWSLSASFGIELNDSDIEICDGLTVPFKAGWHYLWTADKPILDPVTSKMTIAPEAAYVEEIVRPVDFSLIGIG